LNTESDYSYAEDRTDLTLIRWMLSLKPIERLQVLQAGANSLKRLQELVRTQN
jgi:hypothetical protein